MGWQLPPEHVDSLKHPLRGFQDLELKRAQIPVGSTGKPLCKSGQQCEVYQARAVNSLQRWAVKCYRAETPGLDQHYRALTEYLLPIDLPYLVPFQFVEHGLVVRGHSYPLVKMGWAEGIPLNVFLAENADHPNTLHRLAELWLRLAADLRKAKVAHGCLQHEHVFVHRAGRELSVRLVDYDAMLVPAREGQPPLETGHPNYEHPQRRWQQLHDAEADRFPHLVIYTALMCVAAGGRVLWEAHDKGDNLLFRERDFQEPAHSALFRDLWRLPDPEVRCLVGRLLLAAQGNGREVPALDWVAAEARSAGQGQAPDGLEKAVNTLLAGDQGEMVPRPESRPPRKDNKTFGILCEEEDNFDLIVDEEPGPPPLPTPEPAPEPPPLPISIASFLDDPYTATYHFEAWMPERVAVMKVQGFVRDNVGEVTSSAPGLMRVQLLDPYDLVNSPKPGLLAWLGFAEQTRSAARVLAVLEFHMRHKETDFQKLVAVTLEIRPGQDPPPLDRWRAYCNKLFCEARGYFMGLQQ
jgi:hypothetical protein